MHTLLFPLIVLAIFPAASSSGQGVPQPGFEQRVSVEAVRNRINRIKGGDWDDKLDRISFVVKFRNSDPKLSFDGCKAEFFIFAQSIRNKKAHELLGLDRSEFSLPALGSHEFSTQEVSTRYDTTGAIFGAKYDSWALVVRDSAGKMLMKKSSNPEWVKVAEKLGTLQVKRSYDHDLKEMKSSM